MIHSLDNISISKLSPPVRLGAEASLLYRKQVAYVGTYGQYDHGTGKLVGDPVPITPQEIDHWQQSVKSQVADGVTIPMQKTHNPTTVPEETYGYVIDAETGLDEKGRYSLFLVCEFGDAEKAKVAPVADCSIYQPPRYVNGVGKAYTRPIRHLMLTTAATIPGMGKFVALSLLPERTTMNEFLKQLAIAIGIVVPDDATDASVATLITVAWGALNAKVTEISAKLTETAGMLEAVKASSVAMSLPPVVVSTQQSNRKSRLESLVADQKITPAMRDSLVGTFQKPSGVIALALNADQTAVSDEVFDGVILALSLLPAANLVGRQLTNNSGNPPDGGAKPNLASYVKQQFAKK